MNLCPKLSYYRILMNNGIVRIVNLRSVRFSAANKLFCKCFTKTYRSLSGDSMFVPIRETNLKAAITAKSSVKSCHECD